ncbi:hypothetical protein ACWEPM_34020 [Streptomyces sp. NPDC004244]
MGQAQRVLQLFGGLRHLEGVVVGLRSRQSSPRYTDPIQHSFLEPGHAATPVHPCYK